LIIVDGRGCGKKGKKRGDEKRNDRMKNGWE
jgi:hypothetical protein